MCVDLVVVLVVWYWYCGWLVLLGLLLIVTYDCGLAVMADQCSQPCGPWPCYLAVANLDLTLTLPCYLPMTFQHLNILIL